mmetsp:Transcript_6486/g.11236  ORF Transcript_6486/g.11236 Transcript_6486/m.11236 type:complete len:161 (-) Transcript_6486:179-661(-)
MFLCQQQGSGFIDFRIAKLTCGRIIDNIFTVRAAYKKSQDTYEPSDSHVDKFVFVVLVLLKINFAICFQQLLVLLVVGAVGVPGADAGAQAELVLKLIIESPTITSTLRTFAARSTVFTGLSKCPEERALERTCLSKPCSISPCMETKTRTRVCIISSKV